MIIQQYRSFIHYKFHLLFRIINDTIWWGKDNRLEKATFKVKELNPKFNQNWLKHFKYRNDE